MEEKNKNKERIGAILPKENGKTQEAGIKGER